MCTVYKYNVMNIIYLQKVYTYKSITTQEKKIAKVVLKANNLIISHSHLKNIIYCLCTIYLVYSIIFSIFEPPFHPLIHSKPYLSHFIFIKDNFYFTLFNFKII